MNVFCGSDVSEVTFGTNPSATDGYDLLLDMPAFGVGFYAYFTIYDPVFPIGQLTTDYRSSYDTLIFWELRINTPTDDSATLAWSPSAIPTAGELKIGSYATGDSIDTFYLMSDITRFEYPSTDIVNIIYRSSLEPSNDTIPPYAINWDPEDSAVGVSTTAIISVDILDDSSGVDTSSITMVVNTLPVTFFITFSPIPGGYRVQYDPLLPLGDTVHVSITASDLATPPNSMEDAIVFYTISGDTTGFTYMVQGTVYLEGAAPPDLYGSEVSLIDPFGTGDPLTDVTDSNGLYKIIEVTPGYKLVTAMNAAYTPAGTLLNVGSDVVCNFHLMGGIIPGEATISGFVYLADGSTILEGSVVTIDSADVDTTDDAGFYSIGGLGVGVHTVKAERSYYIPQEVTAIVLMDTMINFSLERAIPPDVLIYDFDNGDTPGNGGTVGAEVPIEEILERIGVSFAVTPQDADISDYDLSMYDAIFIVTGIHGGASRTIPDSSIEKIFDFMDSGGKIYWEGANAGHDYFGYPGPRGDLFNRMGVSWEANGFPSTEGNIRTLYGTGEMFSASFTASYAFQHLADHYVDEISATDATIILQSQEHGPAPAVSRDRTAMYDNPPYKCIFSSCYLGGIESLQLRDSMMVQYCEFMEVNTGIEEHVVTIPQNFNLKQNFPNPFNARTTISIIMNPDKYQANPDALKKLELTIYNVLGNTVKTFGLASLREGENLLTWNGTDNTGNEVPAGVYFYKINNFSKVKRMILLK